jgi:hypothetical protein
MATQYNVTIQFLDSSEESLVIDSTNQDHYQTIVEYIMEKRGHKHFVLCDDEGEEFIEGDETERDITLSCIIQNNCDCCDDSPDRLYDEKCAECWLSQESHTISNIDHCSQYSDYSLGVVNYRESTTLKYRVYFNEDGEQERVEKRWNRIWFNSRQEDDIEKVDGELMVGEYDSVIVSSELPEDVGEDILDRLTTIYRYY